MIPLIQKEVVERKKWITDGDILEIIAIAESTPGPIAINAATFIGYKTAGFPGALLSTVGVVLPSFAIIVALSFILRLFENLSAVRYAFFGIRAGVLALMVKALWSMYRQSPKGIAAYVMMTIAFIAVAVFEINVLWVIIGCAVFGLIVSLSAGRAQR